MASSMDVEYEARLSGPSTIPSNQAMHLVRVADHSKIRNVVKFALDFLKVNSTRPLVLHTMPAELSSIQEQDAESFSLKRDSHSINQKCTSAVAKLISIVEIIKREFPKALKSYMSDNAGDGAGKTDVSSDLLALHQYNEVGCLEDHYSPVEEEAPEERAARIQSLLEGKNHPKIKKTPYMKITLCRQSVLGLADSTRATYQAPLPFKFSKAQKARAKKKAAKLTTIAATAPERDSPKEGAEDENQTSGQTGARPFVGNSGSIML